MLVWVFLPRSAAAACGWNYPHPARLFLMSEGEALRQRKNPVQRCPSRLDKPFFGSYANRIGLNKQEPLTYLVNGA